MATNGSVSQGRRRPRRNRNLQYENATWRAFIGALLRLGVPVKARSGHDAARKVGSTPAYVNAMITLMEADEDDLVFAVLVGQVPLLEAAAHVRKRTKLVKTYRASDADARKALGQSVGVDNVWDEVLAPNLS
jgi:hypothetical protein